MSCEFVVTDDETGDVLTDKAHYEVICIGRNGSYLSRLEHYELARHVQTRVDDLLALEAHIKTQELSEVRIKIVRPGAS